MRKAVQSLKRISDLELEKGLVMNASWHRDVDQSNEA